MEDISLHILDIAENSIAAGAKNVEIVVDENQSADSLVLEIRDDGQGMSADAMGKATDPFFTTRTTRRVGLGLALLEEAARMANGTIEIESIPGTGTRVKATFQLSHIDRKPIGSMADTITSLIVGSPDVDVVFKQIQNGREFVFDTKDVRETYRGASLNSIEVIKFVRGYLTKTLQPSTIN